MIISPSTFELGMWMSRLSPSDSSVTNRPSRLTVPILALISTVSPIR